MKTSLLALIYFSTAALNIYLNYIFITKYGIEGAASATLISTSIGFLIHYYFSSNYLLSYAFTNAGVFINHSLRLKFSMRFLDGLIYEQLDL